MCVCGHIRHGACEVKKGCWLKHRVTRLIKMNQRNHAEVPLMNHDHTEHEQIHTHAHPCVYWRHDPAHYPPPPPTQVPGDYANEGVLKGREDLKLISWEQTLVLVIGRVVIECYWSPNYNSPPTIDYFDNLLKMRRIPLRMQKSPDDHLFLCRSLQPKHLLHSWPSPPFFFLPRRLVIVPSNS